MSLTDARPVRHQGRTFDFRAGLHPANLRHLVRDQVAAPAWNKAVWWTGGVVLDQGAEGSCVGHGTVGEYLASPVRGTLPSGVDRAQAGHRLAVDVYHRAQFLDEWPGEDYSGTSVRAGCLVGRERGWWSTFSWALNVDDVRRALDLGPVIVGVEWREAMYSTDTAGMVHVGGDVVGGHCLLVTGYSPAYDGMGRRFRWRNSWGGGQTGYGKNGSGYITPDDLQRVCFDAQGEAAVVADRHI